MDRPSSSQEEQDQTDPKLWVLCSLCWLSAAYGQEFGFPGSFGTGVTVCAQE